jgi:hypothetical protein
MVILWSIMKIIIKVYEEREFMRKMFISKKFLIIFMLVVSLLSGSSIKAYSKNDYSTENPHGVVPVTYYWKIVSNKKTGTSNGAWRNGPSAKGKATLSINSSKSLNTNVASSISGSYPVGIPVINAKLNIKINASKKYSVTYTISIPAKKRYQIIFRPVYSVYTVAQQKYARAGNLVSKVGKPVNAKVKKFSNWDYSWKELKY